MYLVFTTMYSKLKATYIIHIYVAISWNFILVQLLLDDKLLLLSSTTSLDSLKAKQQWHRLSTLVGQNLTHADCFIRVYDCSVIYDCSICRAQDFPWLCH